MKKFVIFGLGRSGTTSLSASLTFRDVDNLVQEPSMIRSGDNHKIKDIISKYKLRDDKPLSVNLDKIEISRKFLDEIYERYDGFKHIYSSAILSTNLNLVNYFEEHDIRVLFLKRRSLLNAVVSNHLKGKEKKEGPIRIPETKIKNTIEWFYTSTANANLMTEQNIQEKNLLTFYYEDLYCQDIEARKKQFNKICEFFEIDQKKLNSKTIETKFLFPRQEQTNKMYEQVPNYHELQEKYKILNG